ncbi:MAG: DUF4344 domain-containing metallopeptidase, partial [Streptococcaceae bacterium]|nr:DUF4344 domain-containing metallopeptidase [Streptococcaceae bacterium]
KGLIKNGLLPEARAIRCPDEASKTRRAWYQLLVEHLAPAYKKAGTGSRSSSGGNASGNNNSLEWDKKSNPFGD